MVEQARLNRQPLPAWFHQAPELEMGLELYWQAFLELNTCRGVAFDGALPIPFTAIVEYARTFEFEGEQFFDLLYFMRKMDEAYLGEAKRKREKATK